MNIKRITGALLFSALLLALPAIAGAAGHIAPTGVTTKPASQVIAWYDNSDSQAGDIAGSFLGAAFFQVTNLSTDTAVNIHVQIFADDVFDATDRCREHDFTDTLTPTDTVLYCFHTLDTPGGADEIPCGGGNAIPAQSIPIDIDETRGFVVATAVSQATLPRQAVSHNYLVASMTVFTEVANLDSAMGFNAMGRKAIDVATGADAPDGALLDGITSALQLLQPSFFLFGFDDSAEDGERNANIVSIAFSDNYSDPNGEYRAVPATAIWDPLMFDQYESGTSCQQHIQTCFVTTGLNNDWDIRIGDDDSAYGFPELCPAVSLDGTGPGNYDSGWVNIAISGLSGLANNLGLVQLGDDRDSSNFADWMHAE